MRRATFGTLIASMVAITGTMGYAVTARGPDRAYEDAANLDITIQGSPYFFQHRLRFQLSASGFIGSREFNEHVVVRFRWLGSNQRPLTDPPTLDWIALDRIKRLPSHLVFDSGTVPEVKSFIAPPRIPPKARFLEVWVDPENRYRGEVNEINNRKAVRLPLPDLAITNVQFLPDDPTLWFVLRNRGDSAVFLPVVAELTWLGPQGVVVGGPYTWVVWPGTVPLDRQNPLVQLWPDRNNVAGAKVPPALPPPGGATSLKIEVNPEVPVDPLVVPVPEENRANNSTIVHFAPDLAISNVRLSNRQLRFIIRTVRGPNVNGPIQLRFQWETATSTPTGQPAVWVLNRERRSFPRSYSFSSSFQRGLQRALYDAVPDDATQLRITVNPSDGALEFPPILEVSTQNNTTVVPRPRGTGTL